MINYKIEQAIARIIVVTSLAFVLGMPGYCTAQMPEPTSPGAWRFGTEVDVLPYAMKGYYASAFAGRDATRLRMVIARSDMPSFMVKDGFKDKRSEAYALLVDRFFGARRKEMQGMWVGGGGEYWRTSIRTDASPALAHYDNTMLTLGGGYVFRLSRHVYVNPWSAGHLVVGGNRNIAVSGETYVQPRFTTEASIKVGFVF